MKKAFFLLLMFCCSASVYAQDGKYAGSMKFLIGKTYLDTGRIKNLATWEFREGSLLTHPDDPEVIIASVYKKGTTWVAILAVKEDTALHEYTIADVLEVKNVSSTRYLMTGICRSYKQEDVEIVALVRITHAASYPAIKAWRFNRDKKRIQLVAASTVDCLSEGGD